MQPSPPEANCTEAPLQLLLFVDRHSSSWEQLPHVRQYLKETQNNFDWELEVIDVEEKPYLAEHFRLIATPALIKIHPEPQQTLAGSNLVAQLDRYWSRWQRSVEDYLAQKRDRENANNPPSASRSLTTIANSTQLMELSDEIFQLKREREELQDQLRFKNRLIAMLAHELRNPLTATSIAIETIESVSDPHSNGSKKLTPTQFQSLIQHARTQTRAIERMIADVLQAAEGEAQLRIQPKQLDLACLCQEVIAQLGDRLEAKSLQVQTDLPNDLPYAYADRDRIGQVLMNLLDNAIKYTSESGLLDVSILHRTSQKIQVSVSDTGLGIPIENQIRIFDDRFRLKRDENKDGYGIGLALCQRIVRAHYGQIWVDSAPDKGSTFHFTLPVYQS